MKAEKIEATRNNKKVTRYYTRKPSSKVHLLQFHPHDSSRGSSTTYSKSQDYNVVFLMDRTTKHFHAYHCGTKPPQTQTMKTHKLVFPLPSSLLQPSPQKNYWVSQKPFWFYFKALAVLLFKSEILWNNNSIVCIFSPEENQCSSLISFHTEGRCNECAFSLQNSTVWKTSHTHLLDSWEVEVNSRNSWEMQ